MEIVPIVPNSAGGGNTKPPRQNKQDSAKCNYCMTLNNWTIEEYNKILCFFKEDSSNEWIIGKEKGKMGTPHLQIYVHFAKKKRFSAIKKVCDRFHIEVTKGNRLQNLIYCSKEGDYETNCRIPRPLKPLACENNLYDWQKDICEIMNQEPDDRTIHWIWSDSGNVGKTTFCKYLHRTYGAICLGGKSADMKNGIIDYFNKNGHCPEAIVINLPRSFDNNYLSYTGIEEVKDMFFYSGKYEGGMVDGNCPHLIIFSNEPPDYSEMSQDRWKVKKID